MSNIKRRLFLKNAGILAGSALLHENLAALTTSNTILKIAVIGCGERGTGMIRVMQGMPDLFNITAISDNLPAKLQSAKKLTIKNDCKTFSNYKDLLKNSNVDAVVVAVPLHLHYQIAVDVINSNKHLYLEKTMTYNIDQALSLVKLMKNQKNLVFQVGHQYRYSPLYYRVKEMINKGYLGKITQVDCRWDRNGSWRKPVTDSKLERAINWRMYKEYSGGLVAELLSHQIDFINWVFDTNPTDFLATGGIDTYKDGRETFDNVQVMMRYDQLGLIGNFGSMCGNAYDGYLFKIKGTLGTVSLLFDKGVFFPEKELIKSKTLVDGVSGASQVVWNNPEGTPILPEATKDGTWYALKDFYNKVLLGGEPDSNVYTGARTAICVHLANQALYSQQKVSWSQDYTTIIR